MHRGESVIGCVQSAFLLRRWRDDQKIKDKQKIESLIGVRRLL
jgi:hypothetical protein